MLLLYSGQIRNIYLHHLEIGDCRRVTYKKLQRGLSFLGDRVVTFCVCSTLVPCLVLKLQLGGAFVWEQAAKEQDLSVDFQDLPIRFLARDN
jgi:hypothetical protein